MAGDLSSPVQGIVSERDSLISEVSQTLAEEALFGPANVSKELSGDIFGEGITSAALTRQVNLVESLEGSSDLEGSLVLSLEAAFEGDSEITANLAKTNFLTADFHGSGVIQGTIPNPINALLGEIDGEAFVVGGIFKTAFLTISFTGTSEIEATIPPEIKLFAGSVSGTSTVTGGIVQLPQCITAPATGSGDLASQLILQMPSVSLTGAGVTGADLFQIHDLRGDLSGSSSFEGEISNIYEGHAEGAGSATGSLVQQPQLIALEPVEGGSNLEGTLAMALEASFEGSSSASGFLRVVKRLNASALGSSDIDGYLVQQPQVMPITLIEGPSNVLGFLQGLAPLSGTVEGVGEVTGTVSGGKDTLLGGATGTGTLSEGLRTLKYLSGDVNGSAVIANTDLFVLKLLDELLEGTGDSVADLTRTNIVTSETLLGGTGNFYARGSKSSVLRKRGPRG